jgi:hypothetical protein
MREERMKSGAASGPRLGACSACPGDYEDPDRTAWTAIEREEVAEPDEEFEAGEDVISE